MARQVRPSCRRRRLPRSNNAFSKAGSEMSTFSGEEREARMQFSSPSALTTCDPRSPRGSDHQIFAHRPLPVPFGGRKFRTFPDRRKGCSYPCARVSLPMCHSQRSRPRSLGNNRRWTSGTLPLVRPAVRRDDRNFLPLPAMFLLCSFFDAEGAPRPTDRRGWGGRRRGGEKDS